MKNSWTKNVRLVESFPVYATGQRLGHLSLAATFAEVEYLVPDTQVNQYTVVPSFNSANEANRS